MERKQKNPPVFLLWRQIHLMLTFNIFIAAWPMVRPTESNSSLKPVFTRPQNNRWGKDVVHSTITYSDQVLMKNSIYPEI